MRVICGDGDNLSSLSCHGFYKIPLAEAPRLKIKNTSHKGREGINSKAYSGARSTRRFRKIENSAIKAYSVGSGFAVG